jgi:hypothetical protein
VAQSGYTLSVNLSGLEKSISENGSFRPQSLTSGSRGSPTIAPRSSGGIRPYAKPLGDDARILESEAVIDLEAVFTNKKWQVVPVPSGNRAQSAVALLQ